ncbi:MBOAT, membrane-bound O-acyltransferase family-domain-containing protein [Cokeromyces recurvatus]|uniref:MBOAT, membrane-bound O-acyltransferase family-domain-containing protein n=1 Tax=Cokeromyces recurvatus TaxID=90255 RepID=UPI00221E7985|nr:MBOAT, membrane-bound O-acyltransferase family-domain-containing protein [Cokeromyces recurvatus]KAI7899286.1 MBOAT, membrane-bound O-acyltransferase family-domain-containing protein [Cokeromyces recurvatus]
MVVSKTSIFAIKEREAIKPSKLSINEKKDEVIISKSFKRLHRLAFKARQSSFDTTNPETSKDTFRGFYTLFWIAMGFYTILTLVRCYEQDGVVLSLSFFRLMSKDTVALFIADILMISQTFLVIPFALLMMKGYIKRKPVGIILQHSLQTAFLFSNIYWVFWRKWPMTQTTFFTLHTIVMMMKMHSYIELNGDLATKYRRLISLKEKIPKWVKDRETAAGDENSRGYSLKDQSELANMESEIKFLNEELTHGKTHYPENLTIMNYVDYLAVPTLIYCLEYPRIDRIRPKYLLEKTTAIIGTFLLLYITTERYIYPQLYNPNMSDIRVVLEVLFPFMMNYMFLFYIIFECILNWFAEITKFADRNFYDDWWNSVTFDEYARKWNKPVHHWLLRHVYAISMDNYKISKQSASFLTFLFSSCLHELVMVIITRKLRMYLFCLQMSQIPLINLGRQPFIKNNPTLGNVIFWIGMFIGPPLLGILYTRQAFWENRYDAGLA